MGGGLAARAPFSLQAREERRQSAGIPASERCLGVLDFLLHALLFLLEGSLLLLEGSLLLLVGSFLLLRSLQLFDEVIVAVGHNTKKNRYFDIDMMMEKINSAFDQNDRVKVIVYDELTANIANDHGAKFLVRGLRNTTDFEYENSISQINKYLNADLETVFLITSPDLAPISSSIIREVHKYGGDVSPFLPFDL